MYAANLKVSSFDLILSLEYLLKIAQFVTVPEEASAEKPITTTTAAQSSAAKQVARPAAAPIAAELVDSNKKITVLINVEQPDIILVERMDDINCLALILNTQIALRFRMEGEKQLINGEIADLKFYICEFNPARRNATKHFVLQPCTLSLHGNTPEAKGLNISLSTSDIRLNISPAIIELLNKAMVTLTASESKDASVVRELPDHSDLWKIKEYKEDEYWFMKVGMLVASDGSVFVVCFCYVFLKIRIFFRFHRGSRRRAGCRGLPSPHCGAQTGSMHC